jgi:hypothetical protein
VKDFQTLCDPEARNVSPPVKIRISSKIDNWGHTTGALVENRNLYIPVVLGTARMGCMSAHAARVVADELRKRPAIDTNLIDIAKLCLPTNDAGEAIKQAEFSANMDRADALVLETRFG